MAVGTANLPPIKKNVRQIKSQTTFHTLLNTFINNIAENNIQNVVHTRWIPAVSSNTL